MSDSFAALWIVAHQGPLSMGFLMAQLFLQEKGAKMKVAVLPFVGVTWNYLALIWHINDYLSCGTSFRIVHTMPPPSDSFENYTGTCCYHHGNLSFFLPMINGPEFRFHLVPWLPDSADRYYPKWPFACPLTQTISVTLRLIKNLSFDRIQFGTCTPKGSCTEQLKQILVCTRYYVKIYISFCCIIM